MWHGGAGLGGGVRAPAIKTQEPTMRQRHCLATRISKACRRPHGGGIGWVSTPMVMRTFGLSERQLGLTLSVSKRRSTSSRRYDIDGRPSRRPCPQSCRHWSRPGKAGLGTADLPGAEAASGAGWARRARWPYPRPRRPRWPAGQGDPTSCCSRRRRGTAASSAWMRMATAGGRD